VSGLPAKWHIRAAYFVGLVAALGFSYIAAASEWSGVTTFLVGLAVAVVYTVFVLVPALLRASSASGLSR
jgi:hypothetical protein